VRQFKQQHILRQRLELVQNLQPEEFQANKERDIAARKHLVCNDRCNAPSCVDDRWESAGLGWFFRRQLEQAEVSTVRRSIQVEGYPRFSAGQRQGGTRAREYGVADASSEQNHKLSELRQPAYSCSGEAFRNGLGLGWQELQGAVQQRLDRLYSVTLGSGEALFVGVFLC
jgi:hypothetical protein